MRVCCYLNCHSTRNFDGVGHGIFTRLSLSGLTKIFRAHIHTDLRTGMPILFDYSNTERAYSSGRPFPFLRIQIERLRHQLSQVQRGEAFLLHAGDCAESFNACTYVSFRPGSFSFPILSVTPLSTAAFRLCSLFAPNFPLHPMCLQMQSISTLVIVSTFNLCQLRRFSSASHFRIYLPAAHVLRKARRS